jgi:hypothetical protein
MCPLCVGDILAGRKKQYYLILAATGDILAGRKKQYYLIFAATKIWSNCLK